MSRQAVPIALSPEEEALLRSRVGMRHAAVSTVVRARIVLAAAAGATNDAIAGELRLNRHSVALWRQRFADERLAGLEERPRPGRPTTYSDADRVRVIETACNTTPQAETHWSVRSLAEATGVGRSTVHRLLRRTKLQPHRVSTFSRSNDPEFVTKLVDVVGLYLDPPKNAVVLCVDEKTQVQALDRTQPQLPMRPAQIARRTHDYKRHDRVQFHPIPTYSSWLNLVEVFFNLLQAKVIRRGNFNSKRELVQRIVHYIDHFNIEGKVFHWTKPAAAIL